MSEAHCWIVEMKSDVVIEHILLDVIISMSGVGISIFHTPSKIQPVKFGGRFWLVSITLRDG